MLPEKNRLKKQKDFTEIAKKGRTIAGDFLVLKKLKNNLAYSRIGFVVSLKISKKAVVRNKIKRRLREIIRDNLAGIESGFDLVFFTKKGIEEQDFAQTSKEAVGLLEKAHLLKNV